MHLILPSTSSAHISTHTETTQSLLTWCAAAGESVKLGSFMSV